MKSITPPRGGVVEEGECPEDKLQGHHGLYPCLELAVPPPRSLRVIIYKLGTTVLDQPASWNWKLKLSKASSPLQAQGVTG